MRPLPRPIHVSAPREWVRWAAAALLVLVVAASGLFPKSIQAAINGHEHHWISRSGILAHKRGGALLGASPRHSGQVAALAAWHAPVAHASLEQAYGWYDKAGGKNFSEDVVVRVHSGKVVVMPATGVVVQVGKSAVALKIGPDAVTLQGLSPDAARPGSTWDAGAVIGRAHGQLSVMVSVAGLPVNPLTSQYFGTRWLHR